MAQLFCNNAKRARGLEGANAARLRRASVQISDAVVALDKKEKKV